MRRHIGHTSHAPRKPTENAPQLIARIAQQLAKADFAYQLDKTADHDSPSKSKSLLGGITTCRALLVSLTEPENFRR